MKINLFFLFAGVAFLFCVIFAAVGGFWYWDTNDRIDQYQTVLDEYHGGNETKTLFFEVYGNETPEYKEAKDKQQEAKDDSAMTPIWFVFAAILLLVAITLIVVHFILEKRADDKMAASFFVDGGEGPPPKEPADK
jgi:hypothetical protein